MKRLSKKRPFLGTSLSFVILFVFMLASGLWILGLPLIPVILHFLRKKSQKTEVKKEREVVEK